MTSLWCNNDVIMLHCYRIVPTALTNFDFCFDSLRYYCRARFILKCRNDDFYRRLIRLCWLLFDTQKLFPAKIEYTLPTRWGSEHTVMPITTRVNSAAKFSQSSRLKAWRMPDAHFACQPSTPAVSFSRRQLEAARFRARLLFTHGPRHLISSDKTSSTFWQL